MKRARVQPDNRLRLLFEANPKPTFIFDRKTFAIIDANASAVRQYGFSRAALKRMKMTDFRPPAEVSVLKRAVKNLGKGVLRLSDSHHRAKSGLFIDVEIEARALDWGGRPAVLSVVTDISRQKATEAALKGAQESLSGVVNNISIAVFAVDGRGKVLLAEGKGLEAIGRNAARSIGKNVKEIYGNQPETTAALRRALAGESFTSLLTFGGRAFETHFAPRLNEKGKTDGFMSLALDVTERRRADVLLHQQSAAIKASMDGMGILDKKGRYIFLNAAHAAIYGFLSPQELIGKNWRTLYEPGELRRFETEIMPQVQKAGQWRGEAVGRRKDGSTFPQEVSLSATQEGELVCVVRDITARKEAETEHQRLFSLEKRARAEAEATSRAKDEFLAVVSHELRTPMTAILGWTWLLRSGDVGSADHDKALDVIERNMKLQAQIIEDLLDISSIVSGKLRLETQSVDIAETVKTTIEALRSEAASKSVEIAVEVQKGTVVSGDPHRLQQILWNLLSNAIKFNRNKGTATIRVRQDAGIALLSVEDTGKGIALDFLPDVFDSFRQGESSLTREHRGLGIGLAIVHHLVELHGGSVSASSAGPDRGATFTVALPLAQSSAQKKKAPALSIDKSPAANSALPHSLERIDIMVVDDEADTLDILAELLRFCGARVRTALSADEAMGQLSQQAPNLLISDLAMPQEDGYSLIRKVRTLGPERGGSIPALALTARAKDEDRRRALEAGFQMYLTKPVDASTLVSAIQDLLRRSA